MASRGSLMNKKTQYEKKKTKQISNGFFTLAQGFNGNCLEAKKSTCLPFGILAFALNSDKIHEKSLFNPD